MSDLLEMCPIWKLPCIKDKCVSYEIHTKQRFKNIKTDKYIPVDQLAFYDEMTEKKLEETIERHVTIVKECRQLAKIIQIENIIDHLIPSNE